MNYVFLCARACFQIVCVRACARARVCVGGGGGVPVWVRVSVVLVTGNMHMDRY